MITDIDLTLLIVIFVAIVSFVVTMWKKGNVQLIHRLYFSISGVVLVWILALAALFFLPENDVDGQRIVDSCTNVAVFLSPLCLLVSLTFTRGWNKLPKDCYWFFLIPAITYLVVWTNPLHGIYYRVFSLSSNEVRFGWYFYVHCVYSYGCIFLSCALMLLFALRNKSALYTKQALLFTLGSLLPLIVNVAATFTSIPGTIVTTLYAHVVGIVGFHGVAIFFFHMLDIKPLALQTVLNRISDCYLVVGSSGLVVSFNQTFADIFAPEYGIRENMLLRDCAASREDGADVYTLINAIESCRESGATISYEQSIVITREGRTAKHYYMVDATPLTSGGKNVGFVVFFKDVSKLKESMARLQNSQTRLMEQERLAFLGQMVGGIAHNLKTPIMSISGSMTSIDNLIRESLESLEDPEVTPEDYREIFGEMQSWSARVREACAYMSDIITAVKDQAANMESNAALEFTMDDVLKRCVLLLRHELLAGGCELRLEQRPGSVTFVQGDVNSMVQVINNLVGNAIYALRPGGGLITIQTDTTPSSFIIRVRDHGGGVSPEVRDKLFRTMVTNKGAMGSGLGLFISHTIIKAKFDGTMWFEDNPGGGAVFGVSIPLDNVMIDGKAGTDK